MSKLLSLLMFGFAVASPLLAQAWVIEPYYVHALSGEDLAKREMTGNDLGLRLGYSTPKFSLGVDASLGGAHEFEGITGEYTPSGYGIYGSFTPQKGVRLYVSAMIKYDYENDTGKLLGQGSKVGLQFTGIRNFALGIEVASYTFDEVEYASGASATAKDSTDYTGLSISFPIEF